MGKDKLRVFQALCLVAVAVPPLQTAEHLCTCLLPSPLLQVNVATAISLMCSHPALTSLAWRAPPQAAAVRTSEAAPGGSNLGSTPATTQAPSQTALPPLGPATEHRKRPSGATDAASR